MSTPSTPASPTPGSPTPGSATPSSSQPVAEQAPRDAGRVALLRTVALVVGVLFTMLGIAGFLVTGFEGFAADTGKTILGFEVNPLHNLLHLVLGVAGILLSRSMGGTRAYGWVLAIGYGAAFAFGLLSMNQPSISILSINGPDNWLHLAAVLVGLFLVFLPVRPGRPQGSALADDEAAGRWMAG